MTRRCKENLEKRARGESVLDPLPRLDNSGWPPRKRKHDFEIKMNRAHKARLWRENHPEAAKERRKKRRTTQQEREESGILSAGISADKTAKTACLQDVNTFYIDY
jgi:hypothetical protein